MLRASPSGACPGIQPHGSSAARLSSALGMHRGPAQQPDRLLSVFLQELSCPPPPQCPAAYGLLKRGRPRPLGTGLGHADYDLSQVSRVRFVGRRARHCTRPHASLCSEAAVLEFSAFHSLWIPQLAWHTLRTGERAHGPPSCAGSCVFCARSWRPSPLDTPSLIRGTSFVLRIPVAAPTLWPRRVDSGVPAAARRGGEGGLRGQGGSLVPAVGQLYVVFCSGLLPGTPGHLLPLPYSTRSGSGPRQQPPCPLPSSRLFRSDLFEK